MGYPLGTMCRREPLHQPLTFSLRDRNQDPPRNRSLLRQCVCAQVVVRFRSGPSAAAEEGNCRQSAREAATSPD
jgi:hypothetical protein